MNLSSGELDLIHGVLPWFALGATRAPRLFQRIIRSFIDSDVSRGFQFGVVAKDLADAPAVPGERPTPWLAERGPGAR
jgi:hypothetical protein